VGGARFGILNATLCSLVVVGCSTDPSVEDDINGAWDGFSAQQRATYCELYLPHNDDDLHVIEDIDGERVLVGGPRDLTPLDLARFDGEATEQQVLALLFDEC
jgi:hypothetical protein